MLQPVHRVEHPLEDDADVGVGPQTRFADHTLDRFGRREVAAAQPDVYVNGHRLLRIRPTGVGNSGGHDAPTVSGRSWLRPIRLPAGRRMLRAGGTPGSGTRRRPLRRSLAAWVRQTAPRARAQPAAPA